MNRYEANLEIIAKLLVYVNENKDLRFNQLLWNANVVHPPSDLFYEESTTTLKRM